MFIEVPRRRTNDAILINIADISRVSPNTDEDTVITFRDGKKVVVGLTFDEMRDKLSRCRKEGVV